jgi:hypothetical protein
MSLEMDPKLLTLLRTAKAFAEMFLKMHGECSWPVKSRKTNSREPSMEYVTF